MFRYIVGGGEHFANTQPENRIADRLRYPKTIGFRTSFTRSYSRGLSTANRGYKHMAESTIIVATFDEESKTYQAFSEIKRLSTEGAFKINGLTVMHRNLEGQFAVKDAAIRNYGGSIWGGVIGSLIGLMAGPLGLLLGWGAGSIIGGIRDAREIMEDRSLFQRLSEDMTVGTTALVGEIQDEKDSRLDQVVRNLGGELLRRPTDDVEADIRAMESAQESARREAQRVMDEDYRARHPEDRS